MTDYTPEQFGAKGGGVDDAAALQQWANAITADTNAPTGILSQVYSTSKQILFSGWTAPFSIVGRPQRSGLTHAGGFVGDHLLAFTGPGPETTRRTVRAAAARTSVYVSLDSVSGLAIGDVLSIRSETDVANRTTIAEIRQISGFQCGLSRPFPFPIPYATASIYKTVLAPSFSMENVDLIGNGGQSSGLLVDSVRDVRLCNVRTRAFHKPYAWGMELYHLLGGEWTNLVDERSGQNVDPNRNTGGSITCNHSSGIRARGIASLQSNGYAMLLNISHSHLVDLFSDAAHGRGIEFYGASGNLIEQVQCNGSGATGLSIVYGCYDNTFVKVLCYRNGNQNVWLNGTDNNNQVFFQVTASGAGFGSDVQVFDSDNNSMFYAISPNAIRYGAPNTYVLFDPSGPSS